MARALILLGGGGHCMAAIDVIEAAGAFAIAGILEAPGGPRADVLGYPVLGDDALLPALPARGIAEGLVAVGQIRSPAARIALYEALLAAGLSAATVVSPFARVSPRATLGPGTLVMHGAVVGPGARVGANCILNSRSLVEHGAEVGDHCHVSTGAALNGDARLGARAFLGSGALVAEGVAIGEGAVVGMGAVVRRPVAAGARYVGGRA